MILDVSAVPPFSKNGFVLACPDTLEGVVVDPGDEVDDLLDSVRRRGITVEYILLTHAHLDHISASDMRRRRSTSRWGCTRADEFLYKAVVQQGVAFGFEVDPQPPVDFYLEDGGPWGFGRYAAWVITRRATRLEVSASRSGAATRTRTLFVGGTLFAGGIGRTDRLAGTSTLLASIRNVLFRSRTNRRLARPRRADDDRPGTAQRIRSSPDRRLAVRLLFRARSPGAFVSLPA